MQNLIKRKTRQFLLPVEKPAVKPGNYDIYPAHRLAEGLIFTGFESLARELVKHPMVTIDGYQGVFFEETRAMLQKCFQDLGVSVNWISVSSTLKPEHEIDRMIGPFLGGDDPLFGTRTKLKLSDFFERQRLDALKADETFDLNIVYGPGASLSPVNGFLVYFDLPKNELQFRARAGSVTNFGAAEAGDMKSMYKRFYFVDWIVLNRHKHEVIRRIDIFADGQRPGQVNWAYGNDIRRGLHEMSRNVLRVRPWFEPGVWGGNWCLKQVEGLNPDVPNYAWSFELIVPENGLLFESSGKMLEVSFDSLMFLEAEAVMGDAFERFGHEFPIRFDFLDTFDGGNLSVQCHPLPGYTKEHFNEDFTQEETYYILDAKDDAVVYLGFQEDIDAVEFETALRKSFSEMKELEIEKYVKKLSAKKHDFFLIPPGTIHASGRNNLVLEISSTPYIFTFKMYDWLRPDLDGKPRPLNIDRAMQNLCFERKGSYIDEKLVSKPQLISAGIGWQIFHLPTHEMHFYDVHRIHLRSEIELQTNKKFHVMSLVQGSYIIIETGSGGKRRFNYAETFVVPAAAGSYRIINPNGEEAILVKAFIK
jgi:mannose-6-phosphate isomerase class I